MSKHSPPAVGDGKRGEQGHIGYLLRQASTAHRVLVERALADIAVTLPQFSVLTMLAAYPDISGADLARLSLLTPQTVSVILGNLERRALIARRPHDSHGRVLHIEVLRAGKHCLQSCRERVKVIEESLLAPLSEREEKAVRKWLVQVALTLGDRAR